MSRHAAAFVLCAVAAPLAAGETVKAHCTIDRLESADFALPGTCEIARQDGTTVIGGMQKETGQTYLVIHSAETGEGVLISGSEALAEGAAEHAIDGNVETFTFPEGYRLTVSVAR